MGYYLKNISVRGRFILAAIVLICAQIAALSVIVSSIRDGQALVVNKVQVLNSSVDSFSEVTRRIYGLASSVQLMEKTYLYSGDTLDRESQHVENQLKDIKSLSEDADFQLKMDQFTQAFRDFIANTLALNEALTDQHAAEEQLQFTASDFLKIVTDQKVQYGVGDRFFQVFKASTEIRNSLERETERRFIDNVQKELSSLIVDIGNISETIIAGDIGLRDKSAAAAQRYFDVNNRVRDALMERPILSGVLAEKQQALIQVVTDSKAQALDNSRDIETQVNAKIEFLSIIVVVLAVSMFVLAAALFGWLIYRHVNMPVQEVSTGLAYFRNGDFTHRLDLQRNDEWSVVEDAFNSLADTINSNYTDLIDERKKFDFLAHHDSLTGLSNRLLAYKELQRLIERHGETQEIFSVIYLDLDEFKNVNDSFGHVYGDELLFEVAQLLEQTLGDEGLAARLGGDEFMIIIHDVENYQQVEDCAKRIFDCFEKPINVQGNLLTVGSSIGICHFPEHGTTVDALIRNSDTAMYHSKHKNGRGISVYRDEMTYDVVKFMSTTEGIRNALKNDEFLLHFQPQYELATEKLQGFEALLRWQKPNGELVCPGEFLPVAEQAGLMSSIDDWVFNAVIQQALRWQEQGVDLDVIKLSINLSGKKFSEPDLITKLKNLLQDAQLRAELFELEITEQEIMTEVVNRNDILKDLAKEGFALAIDDFGTGYSSFNYLKNLPIDTLKIDRDFIKDIELNQKDREITRTIISLANTLDLLIVAEGIETAAQLDLLKNSGCQSGQGHLLSKPLTAEAAGDLAAGCQQVS